MMSRLIQGALANQIVSEKISPISGDLPPETERPVLAPQSSIMGEILFLALTSETHTPAELRSYTETVIGKPGNEIQTPMAIVILFGLLTSMLLNMIIVPALYLRFGRAVTSAGESGKVSA